MTKIYEPTKIYFSDSMAFNPDHECMRCMQKIYHVSLQLLNILCEKRTMSSYSISQKGQTWVNKNNLVIPWVHEVNGQNMPGFPSNADINGYSLDRELLTASQT